MGGGDSGRGPSEYNVVADAAIGIVPAVRKSSAKHHGLEKGGLAMKKGDSMEEALSGCTGVEESGCGCRHAKVKGAHHVALVGGACATG